MILSMAGGGGAQVQRTNGTFRTNGSGTATVNCGFKPDLVVVKVGTAQLDSTQNDPAFAFTESGKTSLSITSVSTNASYIYMSNVCTQTASGFSITQKYISSRFAVTNVSYRTFSYIAVKYTE